MTKTSWTDSLGYIHLFPDNLLLKGGPAAFAAPPPASDGAFSLLVAELVAFRERRRRAAAKVKVPVNTRDPKSERQAEAVSRADHLPTIRQRPGRPAATGTVRKSFATMADELNEMVSAIRTQTAEIQRRTAIQMIDDMRAAARAGRLDALSAAKADALQHRHARALGLETTGVRS